MNRVAVYLLLIVGAQYAWPQAHEPVERRVADLPASQRPWERYLGWLSAQPLETRRLKEADLYQRYKAWLKEGGFTEERADAEVQTVAENGKRADIERWNQYFTTPNAAFNPNPNAFLVEMVKSEAARGRKPGQALDVAMGQGRNSIWLAHEGWEVTGFDTADRALALANEKAANLNLRIRTQQKSMEDFEYGENRWDLILLSYAGCTEIASQVERALKPGGILIVEAFHTDALKSMKIGGSLCAPAELPNAFRGLRVLRYEEPIAKPDFAPRPARIVRFAAIKPED